MYFKIIKRYYFWHEYEILLDPSPPLDSHLRDRWLRTKNDSGGWCLERRRNRRLITGLILLPLWCSVVGILGVLLKRKENKFRRALSIKPTQKYLYQLQYICNTFAKSIFLSTHRPRIRIARNWWFRVLFVTSNARNLSYRTDFSYRKLFPALPKLRRTTSITSMRTSLTCQGWFCWLGSGGCCWCGRGEVAGGVTGVQLFRFVCCCRKCDGCRRSVPPGLTGDGDDGTALCGAITKDGWGDGPDVGLLWYEPRSPYPRVLPEENR